MYFCICLPNHICQVGRLAVKTSCDSWLEHIYQVGVSRYTNEDLINSKHLNIYQKKIKFSEGGAKKLAADFAFFRQWVDSTTLLTPDSKRYLLSLTIFTFTYINVNILTYLLTVN